MLAEWKEYTPVMQEFLVITRTEYPVHGACTEQAHVPFVFFIALVPSPLRSIFLCIFHTCLQTWNESSQLCTSWLIFHCRCKVSVPFSLLLCLHAVQTVLPTLVLVPWGCWPPGFYLTAALLCLARAPHNACFLPLRIPSRQRWSPAGNKTLEGVFIHCYQ